MALVHTDTHAQPPHSVEETREESRQSPALDLQVDLRVYGDAVIATVLRLRWLLSGLLVAATVLFAIGVAGERAQHDQHVEGAAHVEGEGQSAEHQDEAAASGEHGEERTLGVDRESNAIVLPAVVVSLVLAVLARGRSFALVLLALALDVRSTFVVVVVLRPFTGDPDREQHRGGDEQRAQQPPESEHRRNHGVTVNPQARVKVK